ncbi:YciI family protein [Catellatospora vulcania]|uniref:YciI family protein n=1 Tax=Catellatospora vulcania TaxID=1460450 RepID=UPI0012D3D8E5|nr:YciI family protein [Catellatospora vulcania]
MKYVVLIYNNPSTWQHPMFLQSGPLSEQERAERASEFQTLLKELTETGELVDSAALGDPAHSIALRMREGVLAATDGPFADVKEHLAGYFVLDCATPERALELARRFPDVRAGGVELRPVVDPSELRM